MCEIIIIDRDHTWQPARQEFWQAAGRLPVSPPRRIHPAPSFYWWDSVHAGYCWMTNYHFWQKVFTSHKKLLSPSSSFLLLSDLGIPWVQFMGPDHP